MCKKQKTQIVWTNTRRVFNNLGARAIRTTTTNSRPAKCKPVFDQTTQTQKYNQLFYMIRSGVVGGCRSILWMFLAFNFLSFVRKYFSFFLICFNIVNKHQFQLRSEWSCTNEQQQVGNFECMCCLCFSCLFL